MASQLISCCSNLTLHRINKLVYSLIVSEEEAVISNQETTKIKQSGHAQGWFGYFQNEKNFRNSHLQFETYKIRISQAVRASHNISLQIFYHVCIILYIT